MGLIDYFDPDALRGKLKGLLGGMPLVQALRGEASVTQDGLKAGLLGMKPFSGDAGQSAYEAALNIGPMGLGKIVYHGSPHKFDKFDASKIGTGEGAQAYGHGVYLADAPDVAKGYAENLAGNDLFLVNGARVGTAANNPTADAARLYLKNGNDYKAAIAEAQRLGTKSDLWPYNSPSYREKLTKELSMLPGTSVAKETQGQVYKADLPDEWIPKMLDWDKPLDSGITGEQKYRQIVDEASKQMYERAGPLWDLISQDPKRLMYRPADVATMSLRSQGVPGIKYLDGASRGAGSGSMNYVVFPGLEDQVKILERNGVSINDLIGGN